MSELGMSMERNLTKYCVEWLGSHDRKPLIIRGARQVGKTWLVRDLANRCKKRLIELNFERDPSHSSLFSSNDPKETILNLNTISGERINPQNSLLFLDEIQAAPALLSKLRWFAEEMPELPIISAGSLLEFVLDDHGISMPVGRVTHMHLEPMSFEEFVLARNKKSLHDYLMSYNMGVKIPESIHHQLSNLFKEYVLVGGMPEAVVSWTEDGSLKDVNRIQHDLLATYRADFTKYKGRIDTNRLEEVLSAIPRMLGDKFVYKRVNEDVRSITIKKVLRLLELAGVCHRVESTAANGVPLGAEINEAYFKEIFLDTGLCCASLGLGLTQIKSLADVTLINNGGMAEQVVGQLLRAINRPYIEPKLYYWIRSNSGSGAELDYIVQHENIILPLEVKSGSAGNMKSLHMFMGLKKRQLAIRINDNYPIYKDINMKDTEGNPVSYKLLSLPFYLLGQLHRLINGALEIESKQSA